MKLSALTENARTLGALLGLDEQEAAVLLDKRILVSVADADLTKRLASHLVQLLTRTFAAIDMEPQINGSYAAELVIGPAERRAPPSVPAAHIAVGADAVDIGFAARPPSPSAACHGIILFLGACYTAAVATKLAVPALPAMLRPIRVSAAELLGNDACILRQSIDIGEAYLAGAGAVGNAFLYALTATNAAGVLYVCDPDLVSAGNLNRCAFFSAEHIGQNKAVALAAAAQPRFPRLRFLPVPRRLEDVPRAPDGRTFRRLIVGVDSRRVRRALQLEFPREVYDASTTGIEEIVLHFNRLPTVAACLSCIYHMEETEATHERHIADVLGVTVADVRENWISASAADRICTRYPYLSREQIEREAYDSLFKAMCGQGRLKAEHGRQVLAPFAFVSGLAGGLLALEFVRRSARGDVVAPFNYWRASPWASPVLRARALLPRRSGCEFCGDAVYGEVSRRLWG